MGDTTTKKDTTRPGHQEAIPGLLHPSLRCWLSTGRGSLAEVGMVQEWLHHVPGCLDQGSQVQGGTVPTLRAEAPGGHGGEGGAHVP